MYIYFRIITLISVIAFVTGGIWLASYSQWELVLLGLFLTVSGIFVLPYALKPAFMFLIYLEEKSLLPDSAYRNIFLSSFVLVYNYLIMAFWSIGIFWYFITHIDKKLYIPDILWAYAISTFVWNIMALREVGVGQNGVIVTLSYYQIACLGLAVYTYYNFDNVSFLFMSSYFGVLMILSLLTSAFLYRNTSMEKSRP